MKRSLFFFLGALVASPAMAQTCIGLNDTSAKIPIQAISSTDHLTEKTDVGSLTCRRWKNGTDAACSGTSAEVSDSNHPGLWQYTLGSGDVDTAGSLVLRFTASGMDTYRAWVGVGCQVGVYAGGFTGNSASYDGALAAESGTTLTLASGGVDVDNQFNTGFAITVFDSGGLVEARSCITDSTNSGDTIVTAEDITAFIAPGDNYVIQSDGGCNANLSSTSITNITSSSAAPFRSW